MREKIVSKWKNIDNDECLLFFAQTVEELLFYYTIDSYRLPAHNTHSLLDESLSTIQHIKQDILKPGALNSIIEEIEDQFEKDIVMRDFFGTECPELIKHINSSKSIDHKYDTIKYLSQRIENNYLDLLIKRIRSCIEKNERKDIIFLTKSLIIEINKYLQYSKEYIYDQCMHIFFKSKVDGISSYDRFIESFKNDDFEYNILFRIGKGFNQVKKSLNIKYFKIYENLKESDDAYKKWNKHSFLKENKNYIEIVVKAKDEFRALSKGRYQLIGISSHISFLKHAEELSISETALIEIVSKSKIIKSSEISSPIYRRPDTIKTNDFNDKFEKIVDIETTNEIEFNTLQRLNLAFQRHSVSLKSSSFENQLVDLWSGLNVYFPFTIRIVMIKSSK
ncbi:hypothetical protein [Spirochaeta isovalerica]|uniref:Uncharacterized protein n=1 Tax=Spirochaeta isovalerica TaxID=150 RepID=A0A841RFW5_9SPIO|nr:hypothetical protein [Spirochaeta isovalerica]MBB6482281.1 hypothetical protein [Spirochaeta isovalerica]